MELQQKAQQLFLEGRLEASANCFLEAIRLKPNAADLYTGLGAVLYKLNRLSEAETALNKAIDIDANYAQAHSNMGLVLQLSGRSDDALLSYKRALKIEPNNAVINANLGIALEQIGRLEDASAAFKVAIRIDKKILSAWCGIGRIQYKNANYSASINAYKKALSIDPKHILALFGLAEVLLHSGQHSPALRLYRKICRLDPNNPFHALVLGQALSTAARDHEALNIFRQLEKQGIGGSQLLFSKAAALSNLGRYRLADKYYQQALTLDPSSGLRSAYLFTLHAAAFKSPQVMTRELQKWDQSIRVPAALMYRNHNNNRNPNRKLRIGYISPDFRGHVVRQFFEPVMRVHDSNQFEFYYYAEVKNPDHATHSLHAFSDYWCNIFGKTDQEVAKQINQDKIDILVNLAGHTANNRLRVMCYKPAPIQATYLGYFGSTGLSTIDYWITDHTLHPPDSTEAASETIHQLPRCSFCYGVPEIAKQNRKHNIKHSRITFGCFNNASKVSLKVVDAWAEILHKCKHSRLILKDRRFNFSAVRHTWKLRFRRRGIDDHRIELLPNSLHDEYMQTYNSIDIVLDPFPRTGGTTTCDALWMGVPVITLAGKNYVERLSATKLSAIGATELITENIDDYIAEAVSLAEDPERLSRYHQTLRIAMIESPLGDPFTLAKALEDSYRMFWLRYIKLTKNNRQYPELHKNEKTADIELKHVHES